MNIKTFSIFHFGLFWAEGHLLLIFTRLFLANLRIECGMKNSVLNTSLSAVLDLHKFSTLFCRPTVEIPKPDWAVVGLLQRPILMNRTKTVLNERFLIVTINWINQSKHFAIKFYIRVLHLQCVLHSLMGNVIGKGCELRVCVTWFC